MRPIRPAPRARLKKPTECLCLGIGCFPCLNEKLYFFSVRVAAHWINRIQPRSNCVQSQSVAKRAWPVMATLPPEGSGVTGAGEGHVQSLCHADGTAEREPEHAEAVRHANAKMNGERRWRYKPAVIVGRS